MFGHPDRRAKPPRVGHPGCDLYAALPTRSAPSRSAETAVTMAEMAGHVAETLGHDGPKRGVGHDHRNHRSRCRNGRSRWAEIRNWGTLDRDVALRTSWERFCETIKHKRRFFFHGEGRDDRDSYTAASLLEAIAEIGETMGLIRDLQPGTRLWRARPDMHRGERGSARDFGPPPVQFALQSNRMNPPGIPMFYVASTAQTALRETRAAEARIGQWRVDRTLRVFDLRQMPDTPGIFSDAPRNHRLALRFLHLFARDIMTPVARDQRVHVDYLPSQVVTEFVRDYRFAAGKVDGIAYGSTVHSGWNAALFLGPVELGLAKPEWGPTPTPRVSFQKAIRLTSGPEADSGPE